MTPAAKFVSFIVVGTSNSQRIPMQNQSKNDSIVYIVDDDVDVREGLRSLFQSIGLKSQVFGSTAEFLAADLPDAASCLILDIRLPGLSGLDLQAELARAKVSIPIVFITGYGDIPMSVKAMKGGAVEFLSKPIREQDLLDAVRIALDRDHARRESGLKIRSLRERYDALSIREQQVMSLICAGMMNKQAAAEIGISEITVKVHRHNVMKKLGAKSLPELVRMADILEISRRK
jgi:FixJ family two-component response regulator